MILREDPEPQIATPTDAVTDFSYVRPWAENPGNLCLDFWLTVPRDNLFVLFYVIKLVVISYVALENKYSWVRQISEHSRGLQWWLFENIRSEYCHQYLLVQETLNLFLLA